MLSRLLLVGLFASTFPAVVGADDDVAKLREALEREARQRAIAEAERERAEAELERDREEFAEERSVLRARSDEILEFLNRTRSEAEERIAEHVTARRKVEDRLDGMQAAIWRLRVDLARARATEVAEEPKPDVEPAKAPKREKVPAAFRKTTTLFPPGTDERAPLGELCQFVAEVAHGTVHVDSSYLLVAPRGPLDFPVPTRRETLDATLRGLVKQVGNDLELRYDGSVAVIAVWDAAALRNLTEKVPTDDDPRSRVVLEKLAQRSTRTDFVEVELRDCLESLQDVSDVPIEAGGIRAALLDRAVDVECGAATHRTVLNLVLQSVGERLVYEVRDGVLHLAELPVAPPGRDGGGRE